MTRTIRLTTILMAAFALTWTLSEQSGLDAQQQQQQQQQEMQRTQAQRVELDALHENPSQYAGREVTVEGEVEDVFGPRMFSIDKGNWFNLLESEALVLVPEPRFVAVRDRDDVQVTGTVRMFTDVRADVERDWNWIAPRPEARIEAELDTRAVIVAESVNTAGGDELLGDGSRPITRRPTGRMGERAGDPGQPITELQMVADARGTTHVGRTVALENVTIGSTTERGYWIGTGRERLFVVPARGDVSVQQGDSVTLEGTILTLPKNMRTRLGDEARGANVYVVATKVEKR